MPVPVYAITLLLIGTVFLLLGLLFTLLGQRACSLISGYNFKSRDERRHYDEKRLSRDYALFFFLCALILASGGVLSLFWGMIPALAAGAGFVVYFFAHVHLDDRAYEKYRREDR